MWPNDKYNELSDVSSKQIKRIVGLLIYIMSYCEIMKEVGSLPFLSSSPLFVNIHYPVVYPIIFCLIRACGRYPCKTLYT